MRYLIACLLLCACLPTDDDSPTDDGPEPPEFREGLYFVEIGRTDHDCVGPLDSPLPRDLEQNWLLHRTPSGHWFLTIDDANEIQLTALEDDQLYLDWSDDYTGDYDCPNTFELELLLSPTGYGFKGEEHMSWASDCAGENYDTECWATYLLSAERVD